MAVEVTEQPPSLADKLEKPTLRMEILPMHAQVTGKLFDPLAEERDLYLSGTRVRWMGPVLCGDFRRFLLREHMRGFRFLLLSVAASIAYWLP